MDKIKMLYIHSLADLNRKSADIESVYLVRELKRQLKSPTREAIVEHLSDFMVSETDISSMESSFSLISPTIEMIQVLIDRQNPELYEPINLQRAIQLINNLNSPLANSISFAKSLFSNQVALITESADALVLLKTAGSKEERMSANTQIGKVFDTILRNDRDFFFFYEDIIHEGHMGSIDGLTKAIPKGFFFHITLEEEIKKLEFGLIKVRIPADKLAEADAIMNNINAIKKGVERAYELNMRMINLSVVIYTYFKWMID